MNASFFSQKMYIALVSLDNMIFEKSSKSRNSLEYDLWGQTYRYYEEMGKNENRLQNNEVSLRLKNTLKVTNKTRTLFVWRDYS